MLVTLLRTLGLFVTLLVLMRILGKRQLGEMEISELVVSVLIANLATGPLQDSSLPLLNGLLPIIVLFSCELICSDLTLHCPRLRSFLSGRPCLLIRDGELLPEAMRRCRFTIDELHRQLRARDILDLRKVRYAILETDGTLSAILFARESPPSCTDCGVQPKEPEYPYVIVEDGILRPGNLTASGHDTLWLQEILRQNGIERVRDVFLLIAYESGDSYIIRKEPAMPLLRASV